MAKKLVDWEHITHIYDELWALKAVTTSNPKIYTRVSELLKYFEDNVIQDEKEYINEIKRVVYMKIKNAHSADERQAWYEIYQGLKYQEYTDING